MKNTIKILIYIFIICLGFLYINSITLADWSTAGNDWTLVDFTGGESGASSINDLSDVSIVGTPTTGQYLYYDGSNWSNGSLGCVGITQLVYVDGARTDSYTQNGSVGCPYKTIQGAINAITTAAIDKQYTIVINPDEYNEQITMKDYVHLKGNGAWAREVVIYYNTGTVLTWNTSGRSDIDNLMLRAAPTTTGSKLIDSSDGVHLLKNCQLSMLPTNTYASMVTITDTVMQANNCNFTYTMTGDATSAYHLGFYINSGGTSQLWLRDSGFDFDIADNDGITVCIDEATSATAETMFTNITADIKNTHVSYAGATGFYYAHGAGNNKLVARSTVRITSSGNGIGYFAYMDTTLNNGVLHLSNNDIHVLGYASNYYANIASGDSLYSTFSHIKADGGVLGAGTIRYVDSLNSTGGLNLNSQTPIVEFSDDGTLADAANDAVVSEKAIKTYVISERAIATNIYYVDVNGNDSTGDGSIEKPFLTVQHAIDTVSNGDVVNVNPGTYTENLSISKNVTITGFCCETTQIIGKMTVTNSGTTKVLLKKIGLYNLNDHCLDYNAGSDTAILRLDDCRTETLWTNGSGQTSSTSKATIKVQRGIYYHFGGVSIVVSGGDSVAEHNTSSFWITGSSYIDFECANLLQQIINITDNSQNLETIFNNSTNASSQVAFKNGVMIFKGVANSNNYIAPFYNLSNDTAYMTVEGNLIAIYNTGYVYTAFNYDSPTDVTFTNNSILLRGTINNSMYIAYENGSGSINAMNCFFETGSLPSVSGDVDYSVTLNNGDVYVSDSFKAYDLSLNSGETVNNIANAMNTPTNDKLLSAAAIATYTNDLNITVGATGADFTTLESAVTWANANASASLMINIYIYAGTYVVGANIDITNQYIKSITGAGKYAVVLNMVTVYAIQPTYSIEISDIGFINNGGNGSIFIDSSNVVDLSLHDLYFTGDDDCIWINQANTEGAKSIYNCQFRNVTDGACIGVYGFKQINIYDCEMIKCKYGIIMYTDESHNAIIDNCYIYCNAISGSVGIQHSSEDDGQIYINNTLIEGADQAINLGGYSVNDIYINNCFILLSNTLTLYQDGEDLTTYVNGGVGYYDNSKVTKVSGTLFVNAVNMGDNTYDIDKDLCLKGSTPITEISQDGSLTDASKGALVSEYAIAQAIAGDHRLTVTVGASGADFTTLDAAITWANTNAASNLYVDIYIYAGTYQLSDNLTVTNQYIRSIKGAGMYSTVINADEYRIRLSASSKEISHMQFTSSGGDGSINAISAITDIYIHDIYFNGGSEKGIFFEDAVDADQLWIDSCKFNQLEYGISLAMENGRLRVSNCEFYQQTTAISLTAAISSVAIDSCFIDGNSEPTSVGISFYNTTGYNNINNVIIHKTGTAIKSGGNINLYMNNCEIFDNTLTLNHYSGSPNTYINGGYGEYETSKTTLGTGALYVNGFNSSDSTFQLDNSIKIGGSTPIAEFSQDNTLSDGSKAAVVSEYAIKNFVYSVLGQGTPTPTFTPVTTPTGVYATFTPQPTFTYNFNSSLVRAYMINTQAIPNNTTTTVVFDGETYDIKGDFNTTTGIFTASIRGYYSLAALLSISPDDNQTNAEITFKKNTTVIKTVKVAELSNTNERGYPIDDCIYLAVGDTIKCELNQVNTDTEAININNATFYIYKLANN